MNKLKSGDRVVCIRNDHTTLVLGKIYKVLRTDNIDAYSVWIENGEYGYYPDRFELAYIKEFSDKLEGILNEEN